MKAFSVLLLVTLPCLFFSPASRAQYKGPRDYFPKSFPAPPPGSRIAPGPTNAPEKAIPAAGQKPKFKDLPLNTGFYFISDTNRSFLWTKTSANQAKNTKNGVLQTISAETPVQR